MRKKNIKYLFLLFFLFLLFPTISQAADDYGVSITPRIIDETAKERDLLKYSIKLKNNRDLMVRLYPMVYDLTEEGGQVEYQDVGELNILSSLTRWVKIPRGQIEIAPGEEKEIVLEINVATKAVPGKYYAAIVFADGSHRPDAFARAANQNFPTVNLNFTIEDTSVENAQIIKFRSKNIFFKGPVEFELNLKNSGTVPITPDGRLFLYDRRGNEEVEIEVLGESDDEIKAGETKQFFMQVPDFFSTGKYKAKLELTYGNKITRDLQDASFFWIMPWRIVSIFGLVVLVIIILLVYILFKKSFVHQQAIATRHTQSESQHNHADEGVINLRKNF